MLTTESPHSFAEIASGRYQPERELGRGGMSAVWLCWDNVLEVHRAVKLMAPELARHPELRERFLREARVMARLSHPHVVVVYDFGVSGPHAYIVMEHLVGGSLQSWLSRHGPLPLALVAQAGRAMLSALSFAHSREVIHRDVKPANLLIGPGGQVKLGDFGIARAATSSDNPLTSTGAAMGTEAYMAPEQLLGARKVDHRADIYAAGGTLYTLATGQLPRGLALEEERAELFSALPPALVGVVDRATRYRQDERWSTAAEMEAALAALEAELPPAERQTLLLAAPEVPTRAPVTGGLSAAALHSAAAPSTDTWAPGLEGGPTSGDTFSPEQRAAPAEPRPEPAAAAEPSPPPEPAPPEPASPETNSAVLAPAPPLPAAEAPPSRGPWIGAAAGALGLLLAGGWWWSRPTDEPLPEPPVQQPEAVLAEATAPPAPPAAAPSAPEPEAAPPAEVASATAETATPAPAPAAARSEPPRAKTSAPIKEEPPAGMVKVVVESRPAGPIAREEDSAPARPSPWRGNLEPGRYRFRLMGPDGKEKVLKVNVKEGKEARHCWDFEKDDDCE